MTEKSTHEISKSLLSADWAAMSEINASIANQCIEEKELHTTDCNLHSVVEKSVKGHLWGCLRVCLWPCDIQDECFGVLKVSNLSFSIQIEGKKLIYDLYKCSTKTTEKEVYMDMIVEMIVFHADFDSEGSSTYSKLERNWTDFLETFIPFVDGTKSFQLHLWLKKGSVRIVRFNQINVKGQTSKYAQLSLLTANFSLRNRDSLLWKNEAAVKYLWYTLNEFVWWFASRKCLD